MASKTEKLYLGLLPLRVVTSDEIIGVARRIVGLKDPSYLYKRYVKRLVDEGKLRQIRRGLYAVLQPLEKPDKHVPDKFLVASKIRDGYYLGYHTALEFHGSAYSMYNEVYVCVRDEDRFDPFQYRGLRFRPVFVKDVDLGVVEKKYLGQRVRVSGKERTFLDSLDRVEYAGGWEECLKSLQSVKGLDFNKIQSTLNSYDNELLIRKTGLVLELLRDNSVFYEHLSDGVLKNLHEKIGDRPRYLTRERPIVLNEKWRLYVPEKFEDNLKGV